MLVERRNLDSAHSHPLPVPSTPSVQVQAWLTHAHLLYNRAASSCPSHCCITLAAAYCTPHTQAYSSVIKHTHAHIHLTTSSTRSIQKRIVLNLAIISFKNKTHQPLVLDRIVNTANITMVTSSGSWLVALFPSIPPLAQLTGSHGVSISWSTETPGDQTASRL